MPYTPQKPISYKDIKPHSFFSEPEIRYLASDPQLPHIRELLNECLDQTCDVTSAIDEEALPATPEYNFESNLRYLENFLVFIERLNKNRIGVVASPAVFDNPKQDTRVSKPVLEEFDYFRHSHRGSYMTEQKPNSDPCNYPVYFDKIAYKQLPQTLTYQQFWTAQSADVLDLNKKNVRNAVKNLYYLFYDQKLCDEPAFIPLRETMGEIGDFFEREDIRKVFQVRQRNDLHRN